MLGARDKKYICLGPASGFADHYGEPGPPHRITVCVECAAVIVGPAVDLTQAVGGAHSAPCGLPRMQVWSGMCACSFAVCRCAVGEFTAQSALSASALPLALGHCCCCHQMMHMSHTYCVRTPSCCRAL
jgi:hypothetical protein